MPHALLKELAASITISGARSHIPQPKFALFREQLLARRDDTALFHDLVLFFAQLKAGGLLTLAAQVFELARIGLDATVLANAITDRENAVQAAQPKRVAPTFARITQGDEKEVAERVLQLHDVKALAPYLASLASERLQRAALDALGKRPLLPLVRAVASDGERAALITMFAQRATDMRDTLAFVSAPNALDELAMAVLYVLQFCAGKQFASFAQVTTPLHSRLIVMAEDARLPTGELLRDALLGAPSGRA